MKKMPQPGGNLAIKSMYKFFSRHALLILSILVSMGVGALYLSVAPTRITNANFGSDGGDFLAAVLTLGIPHPTGYPTYILLGKIFQLLPFGTPVFRAALESLLPAAIGAGLLTGWMGYVIGSQSPKGLVAAVITGITWGAAPVLFSQAVIVEVHGLQSLIVGLILWWITLNLDFTPGHNERWLLGLSFLVGLGIGNHLTIVLFAPVAILTLVNLMRHYGSWKLAVAQIFFMLAGLMVYIYLPLRSQAYPAINWGNPQTWSGFVWEVSGNPYRGLLFGIPNQALWERIRSIASMLLDQFGALGLIAGAIGLIQYSCRVKWLKWVLGWTFVVYLAFAIGYNTEDSIGYLLPAVMVFAIWIGLAVPSLWKLSLKRFPVGLLCIAVLAVSIWYRIPETRERLDPRLQDQPARYAEQLFREAPVEAIIYTTTDQDTFPLWYYHFGLHERPDLRIIVLPLTQFVWYQQNLMHTYPDLKFPEIYAKDQPNVDWGKEIARLNPAHAVCNTQITSDLEIGVGYQCSSPFIASVDGSFRGLVALVERNDSRYSPGIEDNNEP